MNTNTTQTKTTVSIPSDRYEDSDDCLAAAAADYVASHPEAAGWDLDARWSNDQRDAIVLTVPAGLISDETRCYEVVADLADGQTMRDEQHIGPSAVEERPMTLERAEQLAAELDADRPKGHEDVVYRIVEV